MAPLSQRRSTLWWFPLSTLSFWRLCAARSAGATRELRSSALLSRSSWRMASLPSACAAAFRVMPVSLAARSSSTPRWRMCSRWWCVLRQGPYQGGPIPSLHLPVHDALCSSLMPLVLPSHCLSSWRPLEVRRPASPWTTSPASWSALVAWMFVWDSPSQDGPKIDLRILRRDPQRIRRLGWNCWTLEQV